MHTNIEIIRKYRKLLRKKKRLNSLLFSYLHCDSKLVELYKNAYITTLCSYASGILIERQERRLIQRWICAANITLNLLVLCIFKYFNFFSENFVSLFETFGIKLDWVTLDILLPVGISFYTFQALSYTIDIYQHKMKPTHDMVAFFAFISFFPQLVAGPIERATNLLPQFLKVRTFD